MSRHLRRIERMDSGRKNRVVPEHRAWPGGLASLKLHVNIAAFTASMARFARPAPEAAIPDPRLEPLKRLGADIDRRLDHARMLEAAGVSDELVMWLVKVAATMQITGQDLNQIAYHGIGLNIRDATDAGHAVALEREAVAVWLERRLPPALIETLGDYSANFDRGALVASIRNGLHHANTPPNAQERGQE